MATEVSHEECGAPAPLLAPQPGALVPGRGVPTITSCKNQQGFSLGEIEGCCRPSHLLREPQNRLIYSQTLTLSSREGTATHKAPRTYGNELNCLASERGLEG